MTRLFFIDYKKGFGGKFGIQEDRKDKSAHGWEEHDKLQQHESQIGEPFGKRIGNNLYNETINVFADYKKGFGGKFGVQEDRKDKSAAGWDEHEKVAPHESQVGKYKTIVKNCRWFAILKRSFVLSHSILSFQTTRKDLVESLAFRKTGRIKVLLVGMSMKNYSSMKARQVIFPVLILPSMQPICLHFAFYAFFGIGGLHSFSWWKSLSLDPRLQFFAFHRCHT